MTPLTLSDNEYDVLFDALDMYADYAHEMTTDRELAQDERDEYAKIGAALKAVQQKLEDVLV